MASHEQLLVLGIGMLFIMRLLMVIRRLWNGRLRMTVSTLLVFGIEFDAA
jgi:hypothetical protein